MRSGQQKRKAEKERENMPEGLKKSLSNQSAHQ